MSKLQYFVKRIKRMNNVIQLILEFLYNKILFPSMLVQSSLVE